jgi:hypothetical protein
MEGGTMYTHVSKCKNDKIKGEEKETSKKKKIVMEKVMIQKKVQQQNFQSAQ